MTDAPFDLRDYRHALGAFLTGVTVVTTLDRQGSPRGFTANSFTSVSLDPPLVLVCIDKRGRSFEVFSEGDGYAVNILSESQQTVSNAFATSTDDRFARVEWHTGPAGHPVFEGAAAWLDCRRHDLVDAGDHVIMIGRVIGYHHTVRPPLGYSRGTYVSASLEREAVARTGYATAIVAILEHDEAILLIGDDDAPLGLPQAEHIGDTGDPGSLLGLLDAAGFDAELGFVFSVVDNAETGRLRIVYRGTAEARAGSDTSFRFHSHCRTFHGRASMRRRPPRSCAGTSRSGCNTASASTSAVRRRGSSPRCRRSSRRFRTRISTLDTATRRVEAIAEAVDGPNCGGKVTIRIRSLTP